MSKTYRPWNPDQDWLLPPSPRQWLPENDLVYFMMDVVRGLDLSAITSVYERSDRGYPPFHPRMMVCLLVYSYSMGVRSSRQIARRCERDAGWRVIVGEDLPDFRTISLFRKTHLEAFAGDLCPKEGDRGAGVRPAQAGDGVRAVPAARVEANAR